MVFVSESFDLPVARKLAVLIMGSQGSGPLQSASLHRLAATQRASGNVMRESLTEPVIDFLSNCGVMKVAVDAALGAAHPGVQVPLGRR
jgi:hypothetical protein